MPGDFQVICGSMVGENRRLPASTETPVYFVLRMGHVCNQDISAKATSLSLDQFLILLSPSLSCCRVQQ